MAAPDEIPASAIRRYDALIATRPGIERKGATMPYTALNGHMFSFLMPDGSLALRLSALDREAFLAKHSGAIVERHGHVLKEYVAVPDALMTRTKQLAPLFAASCDYVASLKPKATSR